ncbi:tryptophan--tRNA ligase [Candidatus Peregrinibacteria bacterium]|nr:tryptophan--tRNA ligase [Candidatus Peregrinibacteria bacterium]
MKKRIFTADRPTESQFHLGNYVGSLANRVKLQDEHEEFIMLADLHALTTHAEKTEHIKENIHELVLNYLAVGLDPKKVTFFVQSHTAIPSIALILGMLTPLSVLQRQPALKEKLAQGCGLTYGLLGYPVLMAADILGPRGDLVPVGKDQKAHVEYARDIAQKFNALYGKTLTVPVSLIGKAGTLVGIDGKAKMSKSLGNAIFLLDEPEAVKEKVMKMYTDPTRIHPNDPGHTKGNPVFAYHDLFNTNKEEVRELKARYQKGTVGDVEVKEKLAKALNVFLAPIRERYDVLSRKEDIVYDILREGDKKAGKIITQTLEEMKEAMKL